MINHNEEVKFGMTQKTLFPSVSLEEGNQNVRKLREVECPREKGQKYNLNSKGVCQCAEKCTFNCRFKEPTETIRCFLFCKDVILNNGVCMESRPGCNSTCSIA